MANKNILIIASVIMGLVALLHLLRVLAGWSLFIGSWSVPSWLSILAFLVAGFLSYKVFKISKK